MNETVDLAVIPAAGKGTRMRPATRVVPKALIPVVDRPAIQYVVEEAASAGASEAILVVDPGVGELVHRHFEEEGRLPGLEHVEVRPVIQEEQLGLGHAILTAREAVGDRRFLCLLADNIVRPGCAPLTDLVRNAEDGSAVALRELTDAFLERYGVITPGEWRGQSVVEVLGAVEKPGVERALSRLGLIGRYLFTSDIFDILETQPPGHGGEIQLTDAIDRLARSAPVAGVVVGDDLLDMGNPPGYLEAMTILGLAHPDFGPGFRDLIGSVSQP